LTKAYNQTGPAAGRLNETTFDKASNRTVYDSNTVMRVITAGQSIWSQDGRFQLAMQAGNLILYQGYTVLWVAPGTYGTTNTAIFQTDGNFVVYGPSDVQGGLPPFSPSAANYSCRMTATSWSIQSMA
jgi:hypothetical protein